MTTTTTQLRLLVLGGIYDGKLIPIQTPFLIGRDSECHLRPASAAVSGRHCLIEENGGVVVVRDLDSTNGTFLNDDLLMRACSLRHGDELRVGPLRFRVLDISVPTEVEPVVLTTNRPSNPNETVVNEVRGTDETVMNAPSRTDDEAARLLLAGDEDTNPNAANSEAVMRILDAIEEPAAPQRTPATASDILGQTRPRKR